MFAYCKYHLSTLNTPAPRFGSGREKRWNFNSFSSSNISARNLYRPVSLCLLSEFSRVNSNDFAEKNNNEKLQKQTSIVRCSCSTTSRLQKYTWKVKRMRKYCFFFFRRKWSRFSWGCFDPWIDRHHFQSRTNMFQLKTKGVFKLSSIGI